MRIYDISQEVFGCNVFPGDSAPEKEILSVIAKDSPCNLSAFRMCAHNGTHVDAPYHFLQKGKTIDQVELNTLLGAEIVLLEGICLDRVPEGCYFLNATPINLGDGDGAPCRAILVELD